MSGFVRFCPEMSKAKMCYSIIVKIKDESSLQQVGFSFGRSKVARRGTMVIARDEFGNERSYQSVNGAVVELNISPTTIRRYAKYGGKVMTRFGLMEIETRPSEI